MPERKFFWAFLLPMLKLFFNIIAVCLVNLAFGQISAPNLNRLQQDERDLQELSFNIVNGTTENERAKACFAFIPKLVEALKTEGSFYYPFDSLHTISILTPEDESFKIFTWELWRDNGAHRYYGAIQMNSKELKLYPLFDYSDSLNNPVNEILDNQKWDGCLYYKIIETKQRRSKYYTLFGWDGNDLWSTKKLLEVLHFEDDKPVFGAPIFEFTTDDSTYYQSRFILEFKKDAAIMLNYLDSEQKIVFDHLVAPSERTSDLKFTYIPDGTYEGFEWNKGKWQHIDKVFHYAINEFDNPPVPVPSKQPGLDEKDR